MRVVIVDDEPLARERLRRLLAEFPGYEVVGEAGDGDQALALVRETNPDLVLLDIRMPGTDGLQVARVLAEDKTPPAVIFLDAAGNAVPLPSGAGPGEVSGLIGATCPREAGRSG